MSPVGFGGSLAQCPIGSHSQRRRGFSSAGASSPEWPVGGSSRELPGRQGRLLFAYLAVNRDRVASRDELAEALWPRGLPSAPDLALSALLSKLRRLLPDGALEGRSAIRLELGRHARVDVEAARDGIHRAEALIAARDWYASIGPTLVAHNISQRRFLPGEEGAWIDELRRELEEIRVRALECTARRSLGIGGAEVAVAERTARRLIDLVPLPGERLRAADGGVRETGQHRRGPAGLREPPRPAARGAGRRPFARGAASARTLAHSRLGRLK